MDSGQRWVKRPDLDAGRCKKGFGATERRKFKAAAAGPPTENEAGDPGESRGLGMGRPRQIPRSQLLFGSSSAGRLHEHCVGP